MDLLEGGSLATEVQFLRTKVQELEKIMQGKDKLLAQMLNTMQETADALEGLNPPEETI